MASRKKPEDKNLQILRELVSQPNNKKCFDCRQRGPTYVNMTVGCFVCTSCSGMLRGLNPPHRVKSISMASFNAQEITFLQNHGNEVCRQTWLGLWNSQLPPEPESREEQKVKDFLVKKYERRTWYTSQPQPKSPVETPEVKPLKQLLGDTAPKVVIGNQASKTVSLASPSSETSTAVRRTSAHQTQQPAFNLLGDLGADPFGGSSAPQQQQQFAPTDNSSTFDAFASSPTAVASFSGFGQPPIQQQQQQPTFDAFASSPTRKSSGSFTAFASAGNSQDLFQSSTSAAPPANPMNGTSGTQQQNFQMAPGDRYSALSDLDDLFRSSNTSSVFSTQSTSANAHHQQQQQQQQQQHQQQPSQFTNSQPNPFMSPASGASGIAMFQQQQQKPANPFHQSAVTANPMPNTNMQQSTANSAFSFGALPGSSFGNKGPVSSWPGNTNAQMQQQQPQQFQGIQPQSAAFNQFNSAQISQSQQQQQFGNSVAPFSAAQNFRPDPQQQQQQQLFAAQQQQQFPFGNQPMQGIPGNQQFQAAPQQQFTQVNASFNGSAYQPMPAQQAPQKMISPQQFAGWGNASSGAMPQQQQQQQQQRSSTNPFM